MLLGMELGTFVCHSLQLSLAEPLTSSSLELAELIKAVLQISWNLYPTVAFAHPKHTRG